MKSSLKARAAVAAVAVAAVGIGTVSVASARGVESGEMYVYSSAIPEGASAKVNVVEQGENRTKVMLHLKGFAPNTEYGAHAHVNACSPAGGAAAGPHYQYVQDPVTPSTNPAYANPDNEVWLDLTTNAGGNGHSQTTQDWTFPADRRAKSVIIHVEHTHTGPTDSGVAGARLACINVNF